MVGSVHVTTPGSVHGTVFELGLGLLLIRLRLRLRVRVRVRARDAHTSLLMELHVCMQAVITNSEISLGDESNGW